MTPELWQRLKSLFNAALERNAEERAAFASAACREDAELKFHLERLLQAEAQPTGRQDAPLVAVSEFFRESTTRFEPGETVLGRFRIVRRIGAGGMGKVYRARDTKLERDVAIKVLPEVFAEDRDRMARLEREAKFLAALNHPNICVLYDVGPDYLVMEYIEGQVLRGPVPWQDAVRIMREITSALEAAHRQGILHRDLKPANILLTPSGAKLLDFGLAKLTGQASQETTLTAEGLVIGTAAYMSPEQAQGKPLDERSDLFSAGAVLYELLSGRRAFEGRSTVEIMNAVVYREPAALQSPLSDVVKRCLAKNPDQRFQSATELKAALDQCPIQPAIQHSSIAVLPFTNMSADKDNDYFGDGLAEEIINVLAHVPDLKVSGRTSSFFFRGKEIDLSEVGNRLNVEHILEGSVRKAGNRVRVTAQLIKVADGFHLWSEHYDRELTDIFAIQDEIAERISEVLRIKLSPRASTSARHEPNLRAYDAYLKARGHWFKGTLDAMAQFKESVDCAIALDPEFAMPYMLLGAHYSMRANLGIEPAHQAIPLARVAEERALQLDPSLSEAHALLAVWEGTYSYNWNAAERRWHFAMACEPGSRHIRFWYGNHYLLRIGRTLEAVEAMAWGLEGDPLNLLYRHHWARGLRLAGRLDDAEAELRKVLEVDADFPLALGTLGAVCAQRGRLEEAVILTERAYALTPWANALAGQLAGLLVLTGDPIRAAGLIEELQSSMAFGAPTGMAVLHALCGDFDNANKWAERSIEERYPEFVAILAPLLQPTPSWPALAKLMNVTI